jgi:hypothetical protein
MSKQEKKRLSAVLRAAEYLFLENIALKLVLEHREVPNLAKTGGAPSVRQGDAGRRAAEIH